MPRFRASRRARRDGGRATTEGPHSPGTSPAFPRPAWLDVLEIAALALVPLLIAVAFHPIGDHYTESDFYGAYANGARAMLDGRVDPSRYGIYGPVYEALLALAGALRLELFLGARLLSAASAAVVLAATWALVASALGRGAARWATLLVAATPVFTRYAYSATTDMPAAAFGMIALALLVLGRRVRSRVAAGVLLALATLTRYQAIALFPAGLLLLALRREENAPPRRGRVVAAFGLAFLATLTPWTAWSIGHGFVPGQGLAGNYRFYAIEDGSRNVQDRLVDEAPGAGSPESATPEAPWVLWPRRVVAHARFDATALLGPAFAALAIAGALFWAFGSFGAHRAGLAIPGAFLYLGLVPAFYSDRYRLLLVPLYAAAAAAAWRAAGARPRALRGALAAIFVAVVALLARRNYAVQHKVWFELPRDVLAIAPVLARESGPGTLLSRKGHLGYYAGRATTALPRIANLSTLAKLARASNARWLYFSWYEAHLRPELLALLDTTRTLPGLERIAVSPFPAGVLYRIGPGFGEPGWFADDREHALAEARASIWTLGDSAAARGQAVLAADAFFRGDYRGAVALAREVRREMPGDSLAMFVESFGLARLAGLGEDSPRVKALAADPSFGWLARERPRPKSIEPRPTSHAGSTPEPMPELDEEHSGYQP